MAASLAWLQEVRGADDRRAALIFMALGVAVIAASLLMAFGGWEYPPSWGGYVIGSVLFIGAWLFAVGGSIRVEYRRIERVRKNRLERPEIALRIDSAQIANDLAPLIDSLRGKNGGRLRIVGSDGEYICGAPGGGLWAESLRRWVGEGLRVEYVLANPSASARESLEKLAEETKAAPGTLEIIEFPGDGGERDGALESLESRFGTFHPVLFRGSGGERAMWLEGHHDRNSHIAYNVTWAAPEAMRGKPDWIDAFEKYWSDIGSAIEACGGSRSPAAVS